VNLKIEFLAIPMEQRALKIYVNNGKEATVNRVLDGSTYSG
jgi:hypothetical protein